MKTTLLTLRWSKAENQISLMVLRGRRGWQNNERMKRQNLSSQGGTFGSMACGPHGGSWAAFITDARGTRTHTHTHAGPITQMVISSYRFLPPRALRGTKRWSSCPQGGGVHLSTLTDPRVAVSTRTTNGPPQTWDLWDFYRVNESGWREPDPAEDFTGEMVQVRSPESRYIYTYVYIHMCVRYRCSRAHLFIASALEPCGWTFFYSGVVNFTAVGLLKAYLNLSFPGWEVATYPILELYVGVFPCRREGSFPGPSGRLWLSSALMYRRAGGLLKGCYHEDVLLLMVLRPLNWFWVGRFQELKLIQAFLHRSFS